MNKLALIFLLTLSHTASAIDSKAFADSHTLAASTTDSQAFADSHTLAASTTDSRALAVAHALAASHTASTTDSRALAVAKNTKWAWLKKAASSAFSVVKKVASGTLRVTKAAVRASGCVSYGVGCLAQTTPAGSSRVKAHEDFIAEVDTDFDGIITSDELDVASGWIDKLFTKEEFSWMRVGAFHLDESTGQVTAEQLKSYIKEFGHEADTKLKDAGTE